MATESVDDDKAGSKSRIVYVNGRYLPEEEAKVSVFDRAFLFGDGVYEVTAVIAGVLVDFDAHMARLRRSLHELSISFTMRDDEIREAHMQLLERNALSEGLVYFQVTRGVADRNFQFPSSRAEPTVVLFTQASSVIANPVAHIGLRVALLPDLRWRRRDIKTVQLIYPSLAKMQAIGAGYDDAWLVEDGFVTEGTSSSAHIVTLEGKLVTRPLSNAILPGITRAAMLRLAAQQGLAIEERAFSVEEAKGAAEAFITSATSLVLPVVEIDGQVIGDGKPGSVSKKLRTLYIEQVHHLETASGSAFGKGCE